MFEWRLSSIAVVKEKNYRFSDSWTSISDIGKVYNNKLFTYQEYLKTENSYINLFISIFNYLNAQKIKLIHLDKMETLHSEISLYDSEGILEEWYKKVSNNMSFQISDIKYIAPLILRENIWGVLFHQSSKTYIRFGFDYYVYIRSPRLFQNTKYGTIFNDDFVNMVNENKLFIEYDKEYFKFLVNEGILNSKNDYGNKYFYSTLSKRLNNK